MSVHVTREGAVWTVTLDRPAVRNAVDRATAESLAAAFDAFERDAEARAAVLAGAGGTFCAGADLKAIAEGRPNRTEPEGDAPMGPTRMRLSKPVIAAVAGHAVGGGFELALWCDLRVVEEDAVLGFTNRAWGVPLIDGGTVRLPRLVGLGRALDLVLTGRTIGAAEALAWGIATRVVPRGAAVAEALSLARAIAEHPLLAARGDRLSTYESLDLTFEAAMRNEFERGKPALAWETREGARRFADRRR